MSVLSYMYIVYYHILYYHDPFTPPNISKNGNLFSVADRGNLFPPENFFPETFLRPPQVKTFLREIFFPWTRTENCFPKLFSVEYGNLFSVNLFSGNCGELFSVKPFSIDMCGKLFSENRAVLRKSVFLYIPFI